MRSHGPTGTGVALRANPARCPVRAVRTWSGVAGISSGLLLGPVPEGQPVLDRPLSPEAVKVLVTDALAGADVDPLPYSAHSLRAGFVIYALRSASKRAMHCQDRERSPS